MRRKLSKVGYLSKWKNYWKKTKISPFYLLFFLF